MFSSGWSFPERILLYGEPGVGKTKCYLEIAKLSKITGSDAKFYVIDNDRAVEMMADSMHLDNVKVENVYEWEEYMVALKKLMKLVRPSDFLICDLMSETWTAVQSYYTDQVFGDDIGSYFLKVKRDMEGKDREFEGWTDWKVINKLYFDFTRPFVYKSPCNIIAVSGAAPVVRSKGTSTVGDSKETISIYGQVGYKPEGQKRLAHQFNTTLFLSKDSRGEHIITTLKDRERELLQGTRLKNFALDYLKGPAGWTM